MNLESNIVEYKACILCKTVLVKFNEDYCNNCKKKSSKNSALSFNSKVYYYKFGRKYNKRVTGNVDMDTRDKSEKVANIKTSQIQRSLMFIDTTNTQYIPGLASCLEFNSLNDLSSIVLKTGKFSFSYLLVIGATKLQTTVKIQKLIEYQENDLPSSKAQKLKVLAFPYTSPLQLLTKPSFWDGLLKVYFQKFHWAFAILSITNFDPKTASYHLLSAMYYFGYKSQPNQPEELTTYMDSYAKTNLKHLIRECSLSAIQALLIYHSLYYNEGNVSLHYLCRAHATRIGYALGIHLDSKMFYELENYTRKLVLIKIRQMNTRETLLGNLSINYLTEFGLYKVDPVKSEWQTLNQRTIIHYEDEIENLLYGECCTQLINYSIEIKFHIYNASLIQVKDSRFKSEWNKSRKTITNIYQKYIRIFRSLSSVYPNSLKIYELGYSVKIEYHIFMIEFYGVLRRQLSELSSSDINEALYHCDYLLKLLLVNNKPLFIMQAIIYIIGYQYLDLYKFCTASDRLFIQKQLSLIINTISSSYLPSTSLSFLILKNGYKSIINDNVVELGGDDDLS